MFLPPWVLILFGVLIAGAIITAVVMFHSLPDEDYGAMTAVIWGISLLVIFASSVTWYLWVWFWLWGRAKELITDA